jgi:hypothetical protein
MVKWQHHYFKLLSQTRTYQYQSLLFYDWDISDQAPSLSSPFSNDFFSFNIQGLKLIKKFWVKI